VVSEHIRQWRLYGIGQYSSQSHDVHCVELTDSATGVAWGHRTTSDARLDPLTVTLPWHISPFYPRRMQHLYYCWLEQYRVWHRFLLISNYMICLTVLLTLWRPLLPYGYSYKASSAWLG